MRNRIGILGGTFDPVHNGHLALAEAAYRQFKLEKVLIMPSANPPHKKRQVNAASVQRKEMIQLAIRDISYFEYSNIELERDGYIYSADTLTMLKNENPGIDYFFIIGADSLFSIETWYHPEILLTKTHIAAANRGDKDNARLSEQIAYLRDKYQAEISLLKIAKIQISSTQIRTDIHSKKDVSDQIPWDVYHYIKREGLYV